MVYDCCITLIARVSNDCPYWHSGHWLFFFQDKQTDKTQTYSVGNHHLLELAFKRELEGVDLELPLALALLPKTPCQHSVKTLCKDKRFRKHRHGYVKLIVVLEQQRLFSDHTLCFAEEDYLLDQQSVQVKGSLW
jgi:hypothetical protein